MRFRQLIPPDARIVSGGDPEIAGVAYDSRKVLPGTLFLALKGESTDGLRFIPDALARGAVAILSDSEEARAAGDVSLAVVSHGRRAMAHVASAFYAHPERALALNGVTGTNGKTTTTFLLDQLLTAAGRRTALIGTVEYRIGGKVLPAPHTTPESLDLLGLFRQAVDAGCTEVAMEVSSHALAQGRVWSLVYDTATFTNLTQDHLDYHGTMEDYFMAKRLLFEGCGGPAPRVAVVNTDDAYGRRLMYARGVAEVRTYGLDSGDFRAEDLATPADGIRFMWKTPFGSYPVYAPLVGSINIYNLVAALTAAHARRIPADELVAAAAHLRPVPGRFERVDCGQGFAVIVDYAHTDDALVNVLRIAREIAGEHRILTVFGCGGDRDRGKRPKMGRAAAQYSDMVFVTSDNPRSEEPMQIIADILPGILTTSTAYTVEPDRRRAIEIALNEARAGDLVLIAGKGHEKTQTTREGVFPFDDVEVAKAALTQLPA